MKYNGDKFLMICAVFCFGHAFGIGSVDRGNSYIDNNTDEVLFAQFLNRGSDFCHDNKGKNKDNLYILPSHGTVENTYWDDEGRDFGDDYSCHFTLNVFKFPKVNGASIKPVRLQMVAQEYGTWQSLEDTLTLSSHDTPPRVCALGYSCSTNRTDGGNHLHLIISKANYSPITFKNDSPDVLYVNYDKKSGKCSDNVDIDYQKVLPGGSFTDRVRSTHKGEQCYYEMNVATDKKGLNRVSTKEVVVSDNNNDETYLLSQRSIYGVVDPVISSSEERMNGVMYGVTYTARKREQPPCWMCDI